MFAEKSWVRSNARKSNVGLRIGTNPRHSGQAQREPESSLDSRFRGNDLRGYPAATLQTRLSHQNVFQPLNDYLRLVITKAFRKDNQESTRSKTLIDCNNRVSILKLIDYFPSGHPSYSVVDLNVCLGNGSSATTGIDDARL